MLSRRIPALRAGALVGSLVAGPLTSASYDEGSPSNSTGDFFDTTYDLVVFR